MLNRATLMMPQLVEWRRHIHRHPELGFDVENTAAYAAAVLQDLGYRVRTGVGRTGIVADLDGQADLPSDRPLVAIRADMDALPILEDSDAPYTSSIAGRMHACGHDAHTAIALGVAALLAQERFPGTLRILIQPSEEADDDEGLSGAPRMVQDGAMEGVSRVLALHVDPATPTGCICVEAGPSSAGVDTFFAAVQGNGGHGAAPHQAIDPVYLTGHVLLALHGIVSRRLDPFDPAVITVGTLHGGQAENVIPDHVSLTGTIRYMEKPVRDQLHTEIERALQVARTLGGDYSLKIVPGTPPMINDPEVTALIAQVAGDLLGPGALRPHIKGLGAEDFGCFSEVAPGAMFSLGCLIEGDERWVHHPRFDIDERCLPVGAAVLAEAALRLMQK